MALLCAINIAFLIYLIALRPHYNPLHWIANIIAEAVISLVYLLTFMFSSSEHKKCSITGMKNMARAMEMLILLGLLGIMLMALVALC